MIIIFCFVLSRTGRAGNKGFAYTFITPEQKRYAGHIIKALEMSESSVADELKTMWDEYVKEMEAVSVDLLYSLFNIIMLKNKFKFCFRLVKKSKHVRAVSKAKASSSTSKKQPKLSRVRSYKKLRSVFTSTRTRKTLTSM